MRTIGTSAAALLAGADKLGIIEADLVIFIVKDSEGEDTPFAFWTEHDTETITVTSPWTGLSASYPFIGGGTILKVGDTPRTSDLSIRRKSLTMSAIHPAVSDMRLSYDMKLAKVAVFQALFDPITRNFVGAMLEFVGELNGAPRDVPAAGGEGGVRFDMVSDSRQLTITNPAKRSDAHQRTRSNDGFHKYIGVAGEWIIPFGQESA